MSRFVNVSITGGLANQLFQVATCLSYAWKHGMQPIFLKGEYGGLPNHPGTHWDGFLSRVKKYLIDALPTTIRNYHPEKWDFSPIPNPVELSVPSGNIRLNGCFQSDKHFLEHRKEILELFQPPDEIINKLKMKYHYVLQDSNKFGILHVRRRDYLKSSVIYNTLPIDYYEKTIQIMEEKAGHSLQWFIIADSSEHQWIKDQEIFKRGLIVGNDFDYEDLWMITFFKYIIIANSTFSWWGAWLNQKEDKVIIMPKKWFSPEGPYPYEGIYPEGWIKV